MGLDWMDGYPILLWHQEHRSRAMLKKDSWSHIIVLPSKSTKSVQLDVNIWLWIHLWVRMAWLLWWRARRKFRKWIFFEELKPKLSKADSCQDPTLGIPHYRWATVNGYYVSRPEIFIEFLRTAQNHIDFASMTLGGGAVFLNWGRIGGSTALSYRWTLNNNQWLTAAASNFINIACSHTPGAETYTFCRIFEILKSTPKLGPFSFHPYNTSVAKHEKTGCLISSDYWIPSHVSSPHEQLSEIFVWIFIEISVCSFHLRFLSDIFVWDFNLQYSSGISV